MAATRPPSPFAWRRGSSKSSPLPTGSRSPGLRRPRQRSGGRPRRFPTGAGGDVHRGAVLIIALQRLATRDFLAVAPLPLRAREQPAAEEHSEQEDQDHDDPLVGGERGHRPHPPCWSVGLINGRPGGWFPRG